MTQPNASPLNSQLFRLEYPRSLGTYATYAEVQAVVDTLADKQFPVQHTLIVGTDLKLMERVTGRRSWGRVILGGVASGVWMGLFIGILFALFTSEPLVTVLSSVLIGIVFFTIWSVIGYAASGGKRDFTSMTSTIPMQYELLVEHRHAEEARRLLVEEGAAQPGPASASAPLPQAPVPGEAARGDGRFGQPAPAPAAHPNGDSSPRSNRPVYGQPAGEQASPPRGTEAAGNSAPGPDAPGFDATDPEPHQR